MFNDKYILDQNGNPVSEPDIFKWGKWFEKVERYVGDTEINGIRVSTVFLGLDHDFGQRSSPVLWETMVFGGILDGEMERYTSLESAKHGHEEMVKKVKKALAEKGDKEEKDEKHYEFSSKR